MIHIYLKQAWKLLNENKLVSILSIAGTALSIAAIMLVVLMYQVHYADYAPESNRYRTLYINSFHAAEKAKGGGNRGMMSARVVRECLYPLQTPEAVTATITKKLSLGLPGRQFFEKYDGRFTDDRFWKVFDFHFLAGAPFTQTDFDSGIRQAVITRTVANRLFETTDAVGRMFRMNHADYEVCGVVNDVSRMASMAYADVWAPYTSQKSFTEPHNDYYEDTTGGFSACILAHSSKDFDAIRAEIDNTLAQFNSSLVSTEVNYMNSPLTQWDMIKGGGGFRKVGTGEWMGRNGALIAFLLILPALNIIGIMLTQFRKRRSEIGVRKSFGASTGVLMFQMLTENLLMTCLGGVAGLAMAYGLFAICKPILLRTSTFFTTEMLLKPETFAAAFLFTLLLNVLSVSLPAWRTAHMPVVKALNDNE